MGSKRSWTPAAPGHEAAGFSLLTRASSTSVKTSRRTQTAKWVIHKPQMYHPVLCIPSNDRPNRRPAAGAKTVELITLVHRHFDHVYAVCSHSPQGLMAERVLVNVDTSTHPDLINSRFA
jgi:hypothetical protein